MSNEPDNLNNTSDSQKAAEQLLVLRAQQGEQEALIELVRKWSPRLQRHAMRLTNRHEAAKEVIQESWLAIVRGLNRLEDPACFRRWAYRIVCNKSANWIRQQQRSRSTMKPLITDPVADEPNQKSSNEIERLRSGLRELPSNDRIVLSMHYLDSMSLEEIATSLAIPIGTTKSRLFHARKRLRAALNQTGEKT